MRPDVMTITQKLMPEIVEFAQQLVRTKSFTGHEGDLANLVIEKMKRLDYDDVSVDSLGNVIGTVGEGTESILYDAHMDTVAVNQPHDWSYDPFGGEIVDGKLYGRGSVDMKSALAAVIYSGYIIKQLGLHQGKRILISASIMEEDYDGEAVYSLCRSLPILPDYVVICEPSNLDLSLGHKGRALIKVIAKGISAHGSAPELGDNAIYKLTPLLQRVEKLNKLLQHQGDASGSIAVTKIESSAECLNAIPAQCEVYIDRRLIMGEDEEFIVDEMVMLLEGLDASWEIYDEHGTSYTGVPLVLHCLLPAWEISKDSMLAKACRHTFESLFNRPPRMIKWDFCTNGVATASRLNIPTIGFGPGDSKIAHTVDEYCEIAQIEAAVQFYALLPTNLDTRVA